jgi:hypothetical protein
MNKKQLAIDIVKLMNDTLRLDSRAIQTLCNFRTKCNDKLANHPTIQVTAQNMVGLLGILNGICGLRYRVCACYDEHHELYGFKVAEYDGQEFKGLIDVESN